MCTFAEVDRPGCQQHASSSGDIDHVRDADARTARNTAVRWAASSMPEETRTTAPVSSTSIPGAQTRALQHCRRNGFAHDRNEAGASPSVPAASSSRGMVRRQPNTCCEQICQRRATSDTRAPGTRVSATIRAF